MANQVPLGHLNLETGIIPNPNPHVNVLDLGDLSLEIPATPEGAPLTNAHLRTLLRYITGPNLACASCFTSTTACLAYGKDAAFSLHLGTSGGRIPGCHLPGHGGVQDIYRYPRLRNAGILVSFLPYPTFRLSITNNNTTVSPVREGPKAHGHLTVRVTTTASFRSYVK